MLKNVKIILLIMSLFVINKNYAVITWSVDETQQEYGIYTDNDAKSNILLNVDTLNNYDKLITNNSIDSHVDSLINVDIEPLSQKINEYIESKFVGIEQVKEISSNDDLQYSEINEEDFSKKNIRQLRELQDDVKLTMQDIIALSFAYQYSAKAEQADLESIKLLEKASKGNWYPSIEFTHANNLKDKFDLSAKNDDGTLRPQDANDNRYKNIIEISQNLNFIELRLKDQNAELNTQAQIYQLEKYRQTLALSSADLFLETMHFRDRVQIAQTFSELSSKLVKLVELRFDAGKVTLLDKKKMNLQLKLTSAEAENFDSQLQNSLLFLGNAIGAINLSENYLLSLVLEIDDFSQYANYLHTFVEQSIDYKQALNQLKLSQNSKDTLQSALHPSFDLRASIDQNARIEGNNFNKTNLELNVSYFLFKGGSDINKFNAGSKAYEASAYRLKATEERLIDFIEKSFKDYEQAFKQYNTFDNSRAVAWELFSIQYESFKAGKNIDLTELITSLTQWYNNYLKSRSSYYNLASVKNKFNIAIGRNI